MIARARDSGDFARIVFSGLDLVPLGVALVSEWRPDAEESRLSSAEVGIYRASAASPDADRGTRAGEDGTES